MNTSEAGYVPVQFGMTAGADFEANTMTLEMEPGYVVAVSPVAVLPRATYDDMLAALQRSKKWIEDAMEERGWPRERIESPPKGSHLHAINAALSKAQGK